MEISRRIEERDKRGKKVRERGEGRKKGEEPKLLEKPGREYGKEKRGMQ